MAEAVTGLSRSTLYKKTHRREMSHTATLVVGSTSVVPSYWHGWMLDAARWHPRSRWM